MDSAQALDLLDDEPIGTHGYGLGTICLYLRLVLTGVSLRGAARVLEIVATACQWPLDIPDWTTGRLWLLRLGHAMLTMPVDQADDWAWLIDHSVQIGQEKCLVILGIRLRDLPAPDQSLRQHDLRLIALVPRVSWTRQDVADQLEAATARTGVPRVIVDDHGSDLQGGVAIFQTRHAETAEIYDIKHKAACLLKHRLEKEPRWQDFQRRVGQTRCAVQQTALSFLVPPSPKPKARFMNLQGHLDWAEKVLALLRAPPARLSEWNVTPEQLQAKLGWLHEFADVVPEWSSWQQVVDIAVTYVAGHGITPDAAREVFRRMPRRHERASTWALVKDVVKFVAVQAKHAKAGERLPGSTEVLESCFGKMKELEHQQARGGFTSLVVSFGAMLADTTSEVVKAALEHSGTADVYRWCKETLGTTLFGKRQLAFAECATKSR